MDLWFNDGWTNATPSHWVINRLGELMNHDRPVTQPNHDVPPVDVVESEDGYHFYFEMPGVKADTLAVRIEDGALIVEGERQSPEYPSKSTTHRSERRYGNFHRAFKLPEQYASEKVSANYKDGVLEVSIAKPAQAKPIKIEVSRN
jgi:HSP20 family molecular chaperone IbpA